MIVSGSGCINRVLAKVAVSIFGSFQLSLIIGFTADCAKVCAVRASGPAEGATPGCASNVGLEAISIRAFALPFATACGGVWFPASMLSNRNSARTKAHDPSKSPQTIKGWPFIRRPSPFHLGNDGWSCSTSIGRSRDIGHSHGRPKCLLPWQ